MSTGSPTPRTRNPVDWEPEIKELEDEGRRAMLARDVASLERLWSDRLLVNSPLNRILTKEEVLSLVRSGRIHHSTYEQHIEHLARHGDAAIVMGRETVADPPDNKTLERRFTNTWRKEGGVWRLIARHANIICTSPR